MWINWHDTHSGTLPIKNQKRLEIHNTSKYRAMDNLIWFLALFTLLLPCNELLNELNSMLNKFYFHPIIKRHYMNIGNCQILKVGYVVITNINVSTSQHYTSYRSLLHQQDNFRASWTYGAERSTCVRLRKKIQARLNI